jgi:hypothetical protein
MTPIISVNGKMINLMERVNNNILMAVFIKANLNLELNMAMVNIKTKMIQFIMKDNLKTINFLEKAS